MIHYTRILLLALSFGFNNVAADFCRENFTLGEMPEGILQETLQLLTTGQLEYIRGCSDDITIENGDVKVWLFTRSNPKNPLLLTRDNTDSLEFKKTTKVIIHGWLCSITNDMMSELKEAYLEQYDANVLAVEWTKLAIDLYSSSYCKVPLIAEYLGSYLCELDAKSKVDINKLHVIGHSMGGQICGFVGQEIYKQCQKKVGRITGLDPAGPLYQNLPVARRLDESDALFVDVIHTNQGMLGYFGKSGTVDFYPNCGVFQNGCMRIDNATDLNNLLNLPTKYGCNHLRSIDYMIESINNENNFVATSCKSCPGIPFVGLCVADILLESTTIMGEYCIQSPPSTKYMLRTNSYAPFGKGAGK